MYVFSISRAFRKCYVAEVALRLKWLKLAICKNFFEENGKIQLKFLYRYLVKFKKEKENYSSIYHGLTKTY